MNDNSGIIPEKPADPREVVRVSCVRVGACPALNRNEIVWVLHCGLWVKARVRRRIPGGCYMAEVITYPGSGSLCTVMASTYGGPV